MAIYKWPAVFNSVSPRQSPLCISELHLDEWGWYKALGIGPMLACHVACWRVRSSNKTTSSNSNRNKTAKQTEHPENLATAQHKGIAKSRPNQVEENKRNAPFIRFRIERGWHYVASGQPKLYEEWGANLVVLFRIHFARSNKTAHTRSHRATIQFIYVLIKQMQPIALHPSTSPRPRTASISIRIRFYCACYILVLENSSILAR